VQSTVVISLHNDVATLHPDHHQRKQLLPPNYTTATDAAIINSVSSSKSNTANATTAFVKRSSNNHHQLTVTMPWQVRWSCASSQTSTSASNCFRHTITTTNTATTSSTSSCNSNATTDIVKLSNNKHSHQLTVTKPSQVQLRVVQIVLSQLGHAESTTTLALVPTTQTASAHLHCIARVMRCDVRAHGQTEVRYELPWHAYPEPLAGHSKLPVDWPWLASDKCVVCVVCPGNCTFASIDKMSKCGWYGCLQIQADSPHGCTYYKAEV
jgi:hypothetical protein